MLVLGIESSCDETGVALYDAERGVIAQSLFSQVELHRIYGGVVPELASRDHLKRLLPLLEETFEQGGCRRQDLDGIAYTAGPGLLGALFVGATVARALSYAWSVPSLGVHHMEGHLLAPFLAPLEARAGLDYPFLGLLVSGGHSQLIEVASPGRYQLLGETLDDAVGEAFDKVASLLGLDYPGGPELERLAAQASGSADLDFPRPMAGKPSLNFSFSGLKTHVNQFISAKKAMGQWEPGMAAEVALAFQQAAVESLWIKCKRALKQTEAKRLVVAGGVSANRHLRQVFEAGTEALGARVFFPPLAYCTDNGAMIAYAGYLRLAAGQFDEQLGIDVRARWSLSELSPICPLR
jgi:N6-L-threonylcarbamoyladenine synthase